MSIKSRTPGIASDVPLMEKQRSPKYEAQESDNKKSSKLPESQINNISSYVKKNLAKTVKPRGQENR